MGVTNKIIEILQEEELAKRNCSLCSNPIMTRDNCWLLAFDKDKEINSPYGK